MYHDRAHLDLCLHTGCEVEFGLYWKWVVMGYDLNEWSYIDN